MIEITTGHCGKSVLLKWPGPKKQKCKPIQFTRKSAYFVNKIVRYATYYSKPGERFAFAAINS